ncbi:DUF222 domain-containing protein [Myceligenerans indicum]|uniref:DUF222 domain-containing protein n=1 Tax=Myceligenerans indicum TaxID=2593663 RepID=A0ABS1LMY9_9MICO|nr:DUF222 domain-containing protein [Myceligenerans indicum]MBL0887621.1 DUF222 domain-containing protein [Myceligenerans indicum]
MGDNSTTTSRPVVMASGTVAVETDHFRSLADAVDAVAAVDALLASLAASRAVLMSDLGAWAAEHLEEIFPGAVGGDDAVAEEAEEVAAGIVADRLASVLRVSPEAAAGLVEESRALVHQHPRTLAALRRGRISYGHAQTILGYTCGLHRGGRAALETRLLRHARTVTVAELSRIARTERERRIREPRRRAGTAAARQRRQMSSQAGGSPAWT